VQLFAHAQNHQTREYVPISATTIVSIVRDFAVIKFWRFSSICGNFKICFHCACAETSI